MKNQTWKVSNGYTGEVTEVAASNAFSAVEQVTPDEYWAHKDEVIAQLSTSRDKVEVRLLIDGTEYVIKSTRG